MATQLGGEAPPQWNRSPGWDWAITYQWQEDGEAEQMSIYGELKIDDALREARHSLDGLNNENAGTYVILAVIREDMDWHASRGN